MAGLTVTSLAMFYLVLHEPYSVSFCPISSFPTDHPLRVTESHGFLHFSENLGLSLSKYKNDMTIFFKKSITGKYK